MTALARLAVNWVACDGHGLCADLLPEAISMDEWGFPVVDSRPLSRELEPLAFSQEIHGAVVRWTKTRSREA